ncbi:MAG: hypothetical protein ACT4NX_09455 [Deltaproteobacteria bacterium]
MKKLILSLGVVLCFVLIAPEIGSAKDGRRHRSFYKNQQYSQQNSNYYSPYRQNFTYYNNRPFIGYSRPIGFGPYNPYYSGYRSNGGFGYGGGGCRY